MRTRKTFRDIFGNELGVGDWVLVCEPDHHRSLYHLAFISRLTELRLFSPVKSQSHIFVSWENNYYQRCAVKYPKDSIPKSLIQDYLNILASSTYHTYCLKHNIHELPFEIEND